MEGTSKKLLGLQVDYEGMINIDIMELPINCVVVISEGEAKVREIPKYGEYKIVTHQGKVKGCGGKKGKNFETR